MKGVVIFLLLVCASNAFTLNHRTTKPSLSAFTGKRSVSLLFSTPDEDEEDTPALPVESEEESLFSKINKALDTPILDANNKDDQGALVEGLKKFVRDEPELSSISFSVIAVIFFAVLTRGTMYLINGY